MVVSELRGTSLLTHLRARMYAARLRRPLALSRLSWIFPLYATVILAIGWSFAGLRIQSDRAQTLELERNRLRLVTATMQTSVQAMLSDGLARAVEAAYPERDSERLAALQRALGDQRDIRSLFLWSADHYLRAGRNDAVDTATKAPDWLWTPGSTKSGTNWVGRPLRNPDDPREVVIPVARYVALPGRGVWAGALFDFHAFDELSARLGPNLGVVALLSSSGTVLFRIPELTQDPAQGVSVAQSPAFRQALDHPGAGIVEGTSPLLNIAMLYGYERVYGYELLVVAGRSREATLAPWRDRRRTTLWVTGASSVLLAMLTVMLGHYLTARQRAERTLRESEGRYRALVNALPEAVFVHRGDSLLFVNDTGVRLVRAESAQQLVGRSVLGFAYESEREQLAARMQQIVRESQAAPPIEIQIRRLDGSSLWVEVQGVPVVFSGEPAIQSVLHDVTERRRLREENDARMSRVQRQSDTLLQLATYERTRWHSQQSRLDDICAHTQDALRVSHAAIWLLRHKALRLVSQGRQRSSEPKQLTEADTALLSDALDRERVINVRDVRSDPLGGVLAGTEPRARSLLAAAIRRSGELTGVLVCVNAHESREWFADETQFVAAVADQIAQLLIDSEREQALADLRTLTGELMRLQDEERRRIGRDLHDSTGQTLAALEISLGRLAAATAEMLPEREQLLEECSRLASQCSADIRTASYLLHPPLLDELGLVSALRWLADGIQARSGMEVRLDLPATMARLPRQTELTLFRVAQEALTNVHRHAASPWVAVRLQRLPDSVVLEIEDAGRGIRRAHAGDSAVVLGVGLAGMRERIRQVGGTFVVEADGSGTVVRATLPLERADSGTGAQV